MKHGKGEWWHIGIIKDVLLTYDEPRTYLEIGVAQGVCYNALLPYVDMAMAVDTDEDSFNHLKDGNFYNMTSDDFFDGYIEEIPQVIFIDGDHRYEQVLKDFKNAQELIKTGGTIVLHDTYPLGDYDACGDVFRILNDLEEYRCSFYTYRAWPGLTLVQC